MPLGWVGSVLVTGVTVAGGGGGLVALGIVLDQRAESPPWPIIWLIIGVGIVALMAGLLLSVALLLAGPEDEVVTASRATRTDDVEAAYQHAEFQLETIDAARRFIRDVIRRAEEPFVGQDDDWTGFLVDHFLRERNRLGANMRANGVNGIYLWLNEEVTKGIILGMSRAEFVDYLNELHLLVEDARALALTKMGHR